MTAITISTQITGTPDVADKQAMLLAIAQENRRREGTGLPVLLSSTGPERRTSYEIIIAARDTAWYAEKMEQALEQADTDAAFKSFKSAWIEASPSKRTQALTTLTS